MVDAPNTGDPWASFKPEDAPAAPQSQTVPAAGAAPAGADPWASFNPEADHSDTRVPPALRDRLAAGHAIGNAPEGKYSLGTSFKAIWDAAKEGASRGYDAKALAAQFAKQREEIDKFTGGKDTFGGWSMIRQGVETAENLFHVANGIVGGAGAAAVQAYTGPKAELEAAQQGKAQPGLTEATKNFIDWSNTPYSPDIPSPNSLVSQAAAFALDPMIMGPEGKLARVSPNPETGALEARVIGKPPTPQDFKTAAQEIAPNASPAVQSKVEAVVRKHWDVNGIHPNEVVEAVQTSTARANDVLGAAHDLSAARTPAPMLPPKPSRQYLQELDDGLYKLRGASVADRQEMMERVNKMPSQFKDGDVQERLYRYMEGDPTVKLTPEEGKFFNEHLRELKIEEAERYERLKATDLEGVEEFDPTYVHRMVIGKTNEIDRLAGEASLQGANPVETIGPGNGLLARSTSSLQPRTYFALQAEDGARRLVRMSNDGKSIREADKGGPIKIDFNDRPFKVGDEIKAVDKNWKLVNAFTREIEENTGTRYYKNAALTTVDNVLRLRAAERAVYRVQQMRDTPEWSKYTARGGERGENWISPQMPLFKNDVMDPKMAHIIDDFWGTKDKSSLTDALERVNQMAIKSLFWTPVPHAMNAGAHWFMGRGWDWITPSGLKSLVTDGSMAIKEVVTQGPKYRQLLREGNALIYGGVAQKDFLSQLMQQVGVQVEKHPEGWEGLAKIVGMEPARLVSSFYQGSAKALWGISDVFMMQRVLELEGKGMTTHEAIQEAERHLPNYRVPSDLPILGRQAQQIYTNPILFEFSRYHYGILKGYSALAKDLAVGDMQQKWTAIGQIVALGALQMAIWPGLSHLLQKVTGKEDLQVPSFGPGRLAGPVFGALVDHWDGAPAWLKDYYANTNGSFVQSLYGMASLSPALKIANAVMTNTDAFSGRKVVEPSDWRQGNYGNVAGQALDFGARTMVEPYEALNDAWKHGEDAEGVILKNIFGLNMHGDEQEMAKERAFKFQDRSAKGRHKKPLGMIENMMNDQ